MRIENSALQASINPSTLQFGFHPSMYGNPTNVPSAETTSVAAIHILSLGNTLTMGGYVGKPS